MAIEWTQKGNLWSIGINGEPVISIETPQGCHDSFDLIGKNALRWTRKTDSPVT